MSGWSMLVGMDRAAGLRIRSRSESFNTPEAGPGVNQQPRIVAVREDFPGSCHDRWWSVDGMSLGMTGPSMPFMGLERGCGGPGLLCSGAGRFQSSVP